MRDVILFIFFYPPSILTFIIAVEVSSVFSISYVPIRTSFSVNHHYRCATIKMNWNGIPWMHANYILHILLFSLFKRMFSCRVVRRHFNSHFAFLSRPLKYCWMSTSCVKAHHRPHCSPIHEIFIFIFFLISFRSPFSSQLLLRLLTLVESQPKHWKSSPKNIFKKILNKTKVWCAMPI